MTSAWIVFSAWLIFYSVWRDTSKLTVLFYMLGILNFGVDVYLTSSNLTSGAYLSICKDFRFFKFMFWSNNFASFSSIFSDLVFKVFKSIFYAYIFRSFKFIFESNPFNSFVCWLASNPFGCFSPFKFRLAPLIFTDWTLDSFVDLRSLRGTFSGFLNWKSGRFDYLDSLVCWEKFIWVFVVLIG